MLPAPCTTWMRFVISSRGEAEGIERVDPGGCPVCAGMFLVVFVLGHLDKICQAWDKINTIAIQWHFVGGTPMKFIEKWTMLSCSR